MHVLEQGKIDTVSGIIKAGNKYNRREKASLSSTYLCHLSVVRESEVQRHTASLKNIFGQLTLKNWEFSQILEDFSGWLLSNYNGQILRETTIPVRLLGRSHHAAKGTISQYDFEQWKSTWPHLLMWPPAVPPTQIKRPGMWCPCWLLFDQLTQIRSCARILPAVLHSCNTSRDKCHCGSEKTSSHKAVKGADLQEAAAGGRRLDAAGFLVGVIPSSSV